MVRSRLLREESSLQHHETSKVDVALRSPGSTRSAGPFLDPYKFQKGCRLLSRYQPGARQLSGALPWLCVRS